MNINTQNSNKCIKAATSLAGEGGGEIKYVNCQFVNAYICILTILADSEIKVPVSWKIGSEAFYILYLKTKEF